MIGLKLWFVFLVLLNYDLICRHFIYVCNSSGTCPLHKVRGAPFWHLDLFLPPLGMCSILYFEKYSASNLPLSVFSVAIFKKWLWCIFLKWEELSYWVPTVSNSIQKSGRGWLPYLSPGCFLSHWGYFFWKCGPPWTQSESSTGLKRLKLQDLGRWGLEAGPSVS